MQSDELAPEDCDILILILIPIPYRGRYRMSSSWCPGCARTVRHGDHCSVQAKPSSHSPSKVEGSCVSPVLSPLHTPHAPPRTPTHTHTHTHSSPCPPASFGEGWDAASRGALIHPAVQAAASSPPRPFVKHALPLDCLVFFLLSFCLYACCLSGIWASLCSGVLSLFS